MDHRYCTRCYVGYSPREPCCPKCRNPEFSLRPIFASQVPIIVEVDDVLACEDAPKASDTIDGQMELF